MAPDLCSLEDSHKYAKRSGRDPEAIHQRALLLARRAEYKRSYACHQIAAQLEPGNPRYLYHTGAAAHAIGRSGDAASYIDHALRIDPHHPAALQKLGDLHFDALRFETALQSYSRALAIAPDDRSLLLSAGRCALHDANPSSAMHHLRQRMLGTLDPLHSELAVALALADRGDYEEALPMLSGLVRQRPEDYPSLRLLAEMHVGLRDQTSARLWYERAIQGNDLDSMTGWLLYWSRLGDFERARQIYRSSRLNPLFERVMRPANRRWEGQDLRGKTLHLIAGDIYLGDALQYIRVARIAKAAGARVIAEVPRRLRSLLRTIDGVDAVIMPDAPSPPADYEAHAFWLLYTLPHPVEESIHRAPYLSPPSDLRSEWRERIPQGPALNVGIAWRGSPWRIRDRYGRRSMALEDLRPLASLPEIALYSLQYGEGRAELLQANPAFPAVDLAPDLPNTCAAIERLDVIVTIDTSIAHLAGAMGKRTFLMLPYDACFRWMLDREDTPWYPSLRLFRQTKPGFWPDVVTAVGRALQSEKIVR
ncbi:MAG TPA: tetratricopeptide repeat protein [Bryobacteraceae bacterium]|nr:tetratricopeptide repeat protein [Bryobacteraceae bacterium]